MPSQLTAWPLFVAFSVALTGAVSGEPTAVDRSLAQVLDPGDVPVADLGRALPLRPDLRRREWPLRGYPGGPRLHTQAEVHGPGPYGPPRPGANRL